jgi:hypothetical protein
MTDSNEIAALKASFRGVLGTADALGGLKERVESLDPAVDIPPADLEELARAAAAHAIASAALRGLIVTMLARRGVGAAQVHTGHAEP